MKSGVLPFPASGTVPSTKMVLPNREAENSHREWSGEYFAEWLATPQAGKLGAIPLLVLARAEGDPGKVITISPPRNWKYRKIKISCSGQTRH
jgi:hypothetical protein